MSRQGRRRPRTIKNVKDFWNKEAKEWGEDPRVTIRDHYLRLLEIENVCTFIKGRHNTLDIGCGNGFSSLFYAEVVDNMIGADYAELMVERAKRFLTDSNYYNKIIKQYVPDHKPVLKDNIRFEEGDILNLKYPNASFDSVIAERVLINLPTRKLQKNALVEVARVLKPKGIWVLVEVTEQGHKKIDKIRQAFGLKKLEKYWHNLYLDEPRFKKVVATAGFSIRKVIHFEAYQFLTKVVHPLITAPNEPQFTAGFNNAARVIAKKYPDYKSVMKIGLQSFLKNHFRPLVVKYDPKKLTQYDKIAPKIIKLAPNFSHCSHQVLYILDVLKKR